VVHDQLVSIILHVLLYISQVLIKSESQPATNSNPKYYQPQVLGIRTMHPQPFDKRYPPMLTRCGRYDDSPERSILLEHKDEGLVPSTPMPAHDAPQSKVRDFLVQILLERKVSVATAKRLASQWRGGNGLHLQIENYQTYQCYFEDKAAQVIWRDVHAIIRRESKERQRQRVARRRRAKLAKGEFLSFFLSIQTLILNNSITSFAKQETRKKNLPINLLPQCPGFS
jgi:hypothetical protein